MHADVQLKWVTETEKNNDFYSLERSWDGLHYEIINTQKGAGNSYFTLNYFYTDRSVANSGMQKAYYRLKQTDFNGQYSYSKTIVIALNTASPIVNFTCAPNPFYSAFEVKFNSAKAGNATLEVYASNGKKMVTQPIEIYTNENKIIMQKASSFAAGIYFVKINFDTQNYTHKVIKE